jgi:hypothetical protein
MKLGWVAFVCPLCMMMLDDGAKALSVDEKIVRKDIAELVTEALWRETRETGEKRDRKNGERSSLPATVRSEMKTPFRSLTKRARKPRVPLSRRVC